jgi:hypothetical protein
MPQGQHGEKTGEEGGGVLMAMITRWHVLLCRWARWKSTEVRREAGWPKTSPMFLGMPRTDAYGPGDNSFNDDALYVDGLIQKLNGNDRRVLHEYYVISGTTPEIARRLGIVSRRMFRKLGMAHEALERLSRGTHDG